MNYRAFGVAALGLAVVHWLAFAVVSPFNVTPSDYWSYIYQVERIPAQGDWFFTHNNRQFVLLGLVIADQILPDRFETQFYAHVVYLYVCLLLLLHLFWRLLPSYRLLGFWWVVGVALYIPYDTEYLLSWLAPYSWIAACGLVAINSLFMAALSTQTQVRWAWAIVAHVAAYVAVRGYEGYFFYFFAIPVLFYSFVRSRQAWWAISFVWWIVIGVAFLVFLVPLLSDSEANYYQRAALEVRGEDYTLLGETVIYYYRAVAPKNYLRLPNYALPSTLILGVIIVTSLWLWRNLPPMPFPTRQFWIKWVILAIVSSLMGSFPYIYAGYGDFGRAQFFTTPGHVLGILSLLGLACWLVQARFRWRVFIAVLAVFLWISAHWHAYHQLEGHSQFDQKAAFQRELLAVLPSLEPDTILVFGDCSTYHQTQFWRWMESRLATLALYDYAHGSGIQMGNPVDFSPRQGGQAVYFDNGLVAWNVGVASGEYPTTNLIWLTCPNGDLTVSLVPPEGLSPTDYNPYALTHLGFIPADKAKFLNP